MLSFERESFQGVENIMKKLTGLPFTRVDRRPETIDVQPSSPTNPGSALLIVVTGMLSIDNDPQLKFTHVFQLISNGSGGFWIFNEFFRLNC